MNKTFTYILISGASALAGGVAGYIFCKKRLQAKFDEELADAVNRELESIRQSRKKPGGMVGKRAEAHVVDEARDPIDIDDTESKLQLLDNVKQIIREEFPDEPLNEYRVAILANKMLEIQLRNLPVDEADAEIKQFLAEMQSPPEDEPEEDDDDDDEEEDPDYDDPGPDFNDIMDDYRGRIEVIPNSDYRNLPPTFDFVTFHYFEEDDVLIDDKDMVVDDIEGTVGDALVHFDEEEDDGDTVYLINGDYGLAIEIVRFHSSYAGWNGWGG